MKKFIVVITTLVIALCVAYLGWLCVRLDGRREAICDKLVVEVDDFSEAQYVDSTDIRRIIVNKGLNPKDKKFTDISLDAIEQAVRECPMVLNAIVYRTAFDVVEVHVKQRRPMYRVITNSGSYYVDNNRETFPTSINFSADVPVLSGNVTKATATNDYYSLMDFIVDDSFWKHQVEQVYINNEGDINIVPRVGSHVILMGDTADISHKFEKARQFYTKVLNQVGWNMYSVIDVRYNEQVICTPSK